MQSLEVRDYSVQVRLGVTSDEQAVPQEVRVSLELLFESSPLACLSDELADTVCYRELCAEISKVAQAKSYQTVEHLYQAILNAMKTSLPNWAKVNVRIHKVRPPIDGLMGGVVFGLRSGFHE